MPPKGPANWPPATTPPKPEGEKSATDIKRELHERIKSDQDTLELVEAVEAGANHATESHVPEIIGWARTESRQHAELIEEDRAGKEHARARIENDATKQILENKRNELRELEERARRDSKLEADVLALEEEIRSIETKLKPHTESDWGYAKSSVTEYFKSRQPAFETALEKALAAQEGAPLSTTKISPGGTKERQEFGRLRIQAADLARTLETSESQDEANSARQQLTAIRSQADALYERFASAAKAGAAVSTEEAVVPPPSEGPLNAAEPEQTAADSIEESSIQLPVPVKARKGVIEDAEFEELPEEVVRTGPTRGNLEPDHNEAGAPKLLTYQSKMAAAENAVRPEKEAMATAEEAYLARLKEFHTTKKFYTNKEPEDLKELKAAYDATRLAYADAMQKSATERLARRLKERGIDSDERMNAILERYNGYTRYIEIARPFAEKKLKARYEGLDARKQGIVGKGLTWLAIRNHDLEQKHGKNKARVIRAAATTLAVTGFVGAFGATVGIVGLAGFGLARFGQALGASFAGAAVGEVTAQGIDRLRQRGYDKDRIKFGKNRRVANELDIDSLIALDNRQAAITKGTNERDRHKQKTIIRALTALGVGMGAAATIAELYPAGEVGDISTENNADATLAENKQVLRNALDQLDQTIRDASGQAPEAGQGGGSIEAPGTGIEGRLETGDGANELLYELRAGLVQQYGADLEGAPEHVKHFVNDHSMLERSQEFGFMTEEGSVLVHPGASLSFNEQGELVMQDPNGVGTVKLMDAQGNTIESEISKVKEFQHLSTVDAVTTTESVGGNPAAAPSTETIAAPTSPIEATNAVDGNAAPVEDVSDATTTTGAVGTHEILGSSPEDRLLPESLTVPPPAATISTGVPSPDSSPREILGSSPEDRLLPESLNAQPAALAAPVAEATPAAWQPGVPLPKEPAVFSMNTGPGEYYVHADNPADSMRLAQQYAAEHPGTRVLFNNPERGLFPWSSEKPRISAISIDQVGKPKLDPVALDSIGLPFKGVETQLTGRIR